MLWIAQRSALRFCHLSHQVLFQMKTFKRARITQLSMALAIALSATPVMAQNTSSAISGEVVGANSQPLAGATVTIKHIESGSISTATTDASGRYSARGLRVGGPYTITITKDGQSQTRENVFLQLAETKYVDVTLGGQQVLDTVTVTGVVTLSSRRRDTTSCMGLPVV